MNVFEFVFVSFLALNFCAQITSMILLRRWRKLRPSKKLTNYPPLSVVTSLKGITPQTVGGLQCILRSEYSGEVEFVIVVSDADDPVLAIARDVVVAENSKVNVTWVVGFRWQEAREGSRALNPRSAKMAEGIARAKFDWIYWHAVDSWIKTDHLSEVMSQVGANEANFATSFPVIINTSELGSVLEAAALNVEVARFFLMSKIRKSACVVYGGSLLANRKLLAKGEGLVATLNRLTDDAILARAFAKTGARCFLSCNAVYVPQAQETVRDFLKRQIRWLMIARYEMHSLFFSTLPFMLIPVGLVCGLAAVASAERSSAVLTGTVAFVVFRGLEGIWFQRELGTPRADYLKGAFVAVYDFILPVLWLIALFKKRLDWAGDQLIIGAGGQLLTSSQSVEVL